jgi:hypothetical protein
MAPPQRQQASQPGWFEAHREVLIELIAERNAALAALEWDPNEANVARLKAARASVQRAVRKVPEKAEARRAANEARWVHKREVRESQRVAADAPADAPDAGEPPAAASFDEEWLRAATANLIAYRRRLAALTPATFEDKNELNTATNLEVRPSPPPGMLMDQA